MSTKNSDIFRERLRAARIHRQMSQGDLSQRTGLKPSALSDFEMGRRTPAFHNLRRLADGLDVTADYLLGRVDRKKITQSGATGPTIEKIIRNACKLSRDDLDTLANFAEMLAKKAGPKREVN